MRWASSSGEWLYVRLSVSLVCQLDGLSSLGFTAGVRLPYEWLYIMSPELLLVPFVGMACLNDLHRGLCMDLEPMHRGWSVPKLYVRRR